MRKQEAKKLNQWMENHIYYLNRRYGYTKEMHTPKKINLDGDARTKEFMEEVEAVKAFKRKSKATKYLPDFAVDKEEYKKVRDYYNREERAQVKNFIDLKKYAEDNNNDRFSGFSHDAAGAKAASYISRTAQQKLKTALRDSENFERALKAAKADEKQLKEGYFISPEVELTNIFFDDFNKPYSNSLERGYATLRMNFLNTLDHQVLKTIPEGSPYYNRIITAMNYLLNDITNKQFYLLYEANKDILSIGAIYSYIVTGDSELEMWLSIIEKDKIEREIERAADKLKRRENSTPRKNETLIEFKDRIAKEKSELNSEIIKKVNMLHKGDQSDQKPEIKENKDIPGIINLINKTGSDNFNINYKGKDITTRKELKKEISKDNRISKRKKEEYKKELTKGYKKEKEKIKKVQENIIKHNSKG